MPGVLMIETLTQVATLLLFSGETGEGGAYLRAVENAKFRRQVVPGDSVRLEVELARRRGPVARARGLAYVGEHIVAEADLVLGLAPPAADAASGRIHPTAIIAPGAEIGEGTAIGPYVTIGPNVKLGRDCVIESGAVIEGWTEIGDGTRVFPYASIGLIPQDLKFKGEETRLKI